jgi:hypothetical protein
MSKRPILSVALALFGLTLSPGGMIARPSSTASQATAFSIALKAAEDNLKSEEGRRFDQAFQHRFSSWFLMGKESSMKDLRISGKITVLFRVGMSGEIEEVLIQPDTEATRLLKADIPRSGYPEPPGPSWWIMTEQSVRHTEETVSASRPNFKMLDGAGIAYGGDLGVIVGAPKGWIFDIESGVHQGLHAVMYPKGSSWEKGGEVIYVKTGRLEAEETLEAFIAGDIEDFKKKAPGMEIKTLEPIRLSTGEEALVRTYTGDPFGNHECVAWARHGTGVAIFVLTCRSKIGFDKSVGPFREMVARSALANMAFGDKPPIPADAKGITGDPSREPAPPGATARSSGGYSYWSQFKPETFVSFKYSMNSGQTSPDMLKTITLKKVTPETVYLEYRESPGAAPGRPSPESSSSLYMQTPFEFREADDEFQAGDPLGSILDFDVARILKDPQGTRVGDGREEFDGKAGKLQAAWTKLRFGRPDARMTITVWLSDEVPGGLFKLVKELEGAASFREEVTVADYRFVMAAPAELEHLRTSRKPGLIEIRASAYFINRFRFLDSLGKFQSSMNDVLSLFPIAAQPDPGKLAADLLEKFQDIKNDFEEDRQKAAAELGPAEIAKLAPLLGEAERFIMLTVKLAEIQAEAIEGARDKSIDGASLAALGEEMRSLTGEILNARQGQLDAFKKLEGVTVKFLRNPTTR